MISTVIDFFVNDEITRQELKNSLEGMGLSQRIVCIHLKMAERKKEKVQNERPIGPTQNDNQASSH